MGKSLLAPRLEKEVCRHFGCAVGLGAVGFGLAPEGQVVVGALGENHQPAALRRRGTEEGREGTETINK